MSTPTDNTTDSKKPAPPEDRLGYAIIGIGELTAQELLPALRGSKFSRLCALVSDNRQNEHDQFALEIDHFSSCILQQRQPFTPGEEGLQDQRIMAAIYRSAREGKPVGLERIETKDAFRGPPPERGSTVTFMI